MKTSLLRIDHLLSKVAVTAYLSYYIIVSAWAAEDSQLHQHIRLLQKEGVQPNATYIAQDQHQAVPTSPTSSTSSVNQPKPVIEHADSVQALNAAAFKRAVQGALPLSSEQIHVLRQQFNRTQQAITTYPHMSPQPVIASRYINLSPGSTPMAVQLAQGYVSTLAFLDATGQPWPIEHYNIGDPQAFNVQWDQKGNLMMIQANTLYNTGNLAVKLKNLDVPVMLTLLSGQKQVDYRLDIRVEGRGPQAKPLLGRDLPSHIGEDLLNVLDGIPPLKHQVLQVTGGEAQAWVVGKRLYLRTRLTVLSPAWLATVSSPDGMKAYELLNTSLVLGVINGKILQLKLQSV